MTRDKESCRRTLFLNGFDSGISGNSISSFESIFGALDDGSADEWRGGESSGASQWQDSTWCGSEERHGARWFEKVGLIELEEWNPEDLRNLLGNIDCCDDFFTQQNFERVAGIWTKGKWHDDEIYFVASSIPVSFAAFQLQCGFYSVDRGRVRILSAKG